MRVFLCLAVCWSGPVVAETVMATSTITAVTVFPEGAEVVREVVFTATAGRHDLLITDLPSGTLPQLIRLAPADGLSVGAYALRTDRLPPRDLVPTPAMQAAKADIAAQEVLLAQAQASVDAINAQIEAADAQAAFLRGVKAEGNGVTVDALRDMSQMIGAEVLAAKQAMLAAAAGLPVAQKAVEKAAENLANAQAALDALSRGDTEYAALSVAVGLQAAGETRLSVTHFISEASWQPVYDLMLTRQPTPALTIARGVLVSQYSGEDWSDVGLTLSTAQPSAQAAASTLWPELRRIVEEDAEAAPFADGMLKAAAPLASEMAEPVVEVGAVAQAGLRGDVVVYDYPTPVDIASGVEDLRLKLDDIALVPVVEARAVPRLDATAFVSARFTNNTDEILLPGEAFLLREGTLVGSVWLDGIAAGAEADVAFGAIDALRLRRDLPLRAEGDRGFLATSSQIEETSVLEVENLGTETWPVRLLDLVPYSEQEDLEISYSAEPAPAEVDVEGQRGVLAWTFDLPPGETRKIKLDHLISWPEGMILQ